MDSVTIENYRCFRDRQTARMAPLTLLVGENSTGKTSFQALLRALWEVAIYEVVPDFRRELYDLGAFSEIVYNDSSRGEPCEAFQAGFADSVEAVSFRFTFEDVDGVTFPVSRCASVGDVLFEIIAWPGQKGEFGLGIENRKWKVDSTIVQVGSSRERLIPIDILPWSVLRGSERSESPNWVRDATEQHEELSLEEEDVRRVKESREFLDLWQSYHRYSHDRDGALFAGAPVRSKPRRTYDPSRLIPDPEGEYVPAYLSMMSRRDPSTWKDLKESLEKFGSDFGLFDEISVESFGRPDDAAPFQIQIRKFGRNLKGNRRNLIDVGYGVSQALPLMTELLHPNAPPMFLLQQPEIYLHPSAQAALGSLFCSIAGPDRQLVVETHSDYIIDRVRMDVRDKKTDLKPEDVSILYFERGDSDVKIHSIRLDEHGNILDAPEGYRQFFADELTRSIGL